MRAARAAALVALLSVVATPVPARAVAQQVIAGDDLKFDPSALTINPGDTVTWKVVTQANPPMHHTVTADDRSFDSGDLTSARPYSRTFTTPGTFTYQCSYHGVAYGMKGTVVVRGSPTTTVPSTTTTAPSTTTTAPSTTTSSPSTAPTSPTTTAAAPTTTTRPRARRSVTTTTAHPATPTTQAALPVSRVHPRDPTAAAGALAIILLLGIAGGAFGVRVMRGERT
ncbi:MAG: hypothetical protein E6G17_03585 [Actinobacteria bacterium]|nr:MAG: hypothetical protein E6G17_03585 [Actinomycetota bacterium]